MVTELTRNLLEDHIRALDRSIKNKKEIVASQRKLADELEEEIIALSEKRAAFQKDLDS